MMNRPQRQVKAPKRLIEEDEPKPKRSLNVRINDNPSVDVDEIIRDTKLKPPKSSKRSINMKVSDNPPVDVEEIIRTTKPKKPTTRTLNLDLSNLPPSDDKKFQKDFGLYSNPFWVNHFYTPKDSITKLYQSATYKLADILPANFQLYDDEPTAFGVANLELKDEFKRPFKRVPLLSELEKGEYETASSKSDGNIASSIKFFRNQLPSFKKYAFTDDISWVVNQHRLLMAEMLDYYSRQEKRPSPTTIKSKVNAITRIIRIAFNTKNYELYDKFSALVIFLGAFFEDDEFNNELNEIELKKFITFDVVLDKQKALEKQFEMIPNKYIGAHFERIWPLIFTHKS